MSDVFLIRSQARRPVEVAVLVLATIAAVGAWYSGLRPLAAVIILICVLPTLTRLVLNPRQGFRLTADRIELFQPGQHRIIPLQRVDRVAVAATGTGSLCELRLLSGEEIRMPATARICPAVLTSQFRQRGVAVTG